jgi:hypothetical protein
MGTAIEIPVYEQNDPRYKAAGHVSERLVPVIADHASNALAKETIGKSDHVFVRGVPSIARSEAILAKIKELIEAQDAEDARRGIRRSYMVVDGSGEFGVFDDHLARVSGALGPVGYFTDDGWQGKDRRVRYYSHRDSRGVDSVMGDDTIGFVVVSAKRTRLNDAAQAMYRLRRLANGQKVVFIVCVETDYPIDLLDALQKNEEAYAKAAEPHMKRQKEHAQKRKQSKADFSRETRYDAVSASGVALAHKEQEQTQVESQVHVNTQQKQAEQAYERCYTADGAPGVFKTTQSEATFPIKEHMLALNVSLSPIITGAERIEPKHRAFVVIKERIVIMALAEVWSVHVKEPRVEYRAYTYDGVLVRTAGSAPSRGVLLFGRFLCDHELTILEEYELAAHLRGVYTTKVQREALIAVMSCLYGSLFLQQPAFVLGGLRETSVESVGKATAEEILAQIKERMFAGSEYLSELVRPYVKFAPSFGRARRYV